MSKQNIHSSVSSNYVRKHNTKISLRRGAKTIRQRSLNDSGDPESNGRARDHVVGSSALSELQEPRIMTGLTSNTYTPCPRTGRNQLRKPKRSVTMLVFNLKRCTLQILSLAFAALCVHQLLYLTFVGLRVRSREYSSLQSPSFFDEMVYNEDLRCCRIVRRRLAGRLPGLAPPRNIPPPRKPTPEDIMAMDREMEKQLKEAEARKKEIIEDQQKALTLAVRQSMLKKSSQTQCPNVTKPTKRAVENLVSPPMPRMVLPHVKFPKLPSSFLDDQAIRMNEKLNKVRLRIQQSYDDLSPPPKPPAVSRLKDSLTNNIQTSVPDT